MQVYSVTQSCPTLCNPMGLWPIRLLCYGVSQARILKQVAISYSRGSSWTRDQTHLLHLLHWQADLGNSSSKGYFCTAARDIVVFEAPFMGINCREISCTGWHSSYLGVTPGQFCLKANIRTTAQNTICFLLLPAIAPGVRRAGMGFEGDSQEPSFIHLAKLLLHSYYVLGCTFCGPWPCGQRRQIRKYKKPWGYLGSVPEICKRYGWGVGKGFF